MNKYRVTVLGRRGGFAFEKYFYPLTEQGYRKARDKRAELLVRYTGCEVDLDRVDKKGNVKQQSA